jgi:predicted DNA binding CopG/RHH family protein
MGPTGAKPALNRLPSVLLVLSDRKESEFSFSAELQSRHPHPSEAPMAVLIPRIRSINVRLSEHEFQAIEQYCAASGARSISELVRTTMHGLVAGASEKRGSASNFDEYSIHVKNLERKVAALAAELALLKAGDAPRTIERAYESNKVSDGVEAPED